MSKLKTAEELLETLANLTYETEGDLLFDGPLGQERRRQSCLTELRAFQRNALEAAAKRLEGLATHAGDDCARIVRELIPENPAPTAGKDDHEGIRDATC